MFAKQDAKAKKQNAPDPAFFGKLENSKTTLLHSEDHDVFGDGTVVLKFTPGHTPGHQSLFLKLAKTGPIVLSGDLYHYPEERSLGIVPGFDVNGEQTKKSRADLEVFLKKSGAQLWIQHATADNAKLKQAPNFYE
jgi:glyoxylase-like metal-dependent hydrolase (beta-lactamase superfamily II)